MINAAGQIVCRNTIAQAFGCVPFNPFGGDPDHPGQIAYFDGQNGPGGTTIGPTAIQTVRQEAFSFSVNGSPIDDWAGPVAVAAGYEYREEHYSQRADPYSGGITASTPATVNEPCTDPFIDCGLHHRSAASGRLERGQLSQRPRHLSCERSVRGIGYSAAERPLLGQGRSRPGAAAMRATRTAG